MEDTTWARTTWENLRLVAHDGFILWNLLLLVILLLLLLQSICSLGCNTVVMNPTAPVFSKSYIYHMYRYLYRYLLVIVVLTSTVEYCLKSTFLSPHINQVLLQTEKSTVSFWLMWKNPSDQKNYHSSLRPFTSTKRQMTMKTWWPQWWACSQKKTRTSTFYPVSSFNELHAFTLLQYIFGRLNNNLLSMIFNHISAGFGTFIRPHHKERYQHMLEALAGQSADAPALSEDPETCGNALVR